MADLTSSWSRYLPVDIGLPFSIAAFRGAKKCNPCLRNVLLPMSQVAQPSASSQTEGTFRRLLQKGATSR
jgi:hypothetical protein